MNEQEKISIRERNSALINTILEFAISNSMSMKEVDECIEEVKSVFYTDGLIKRQ